MEENDKPQISLKTYLVFVLGILALVFLIQNSNDVEFQLIFWKIDKIPLILLLLLFFAFGAIISWVLIMRKVNVKKKIIRKLEKEIEILKKEAKQ